MDAQLLWHDFFDGIPVFQLYVYTTTSAKECRILYFKTLPLIEDPSLCLLPSLCYWYLWIYLCHTPLAPWSSLCPCWTFPPLCSYARTKMGCSIPAWNLVTLVNIAVVSTSKIPWCIPSRRMYYFSQLFINASILLRQFLMIQCCTLPYMLQSLQLRSLCIQTNRSTRYHAICNAAWQRSVIHRAELDQSPSSTIWKTTC